MIQGIWLLTIMCAALLALWGHEQWKRKQAEHRAELAEAKAENLRERLVITEQQLEWYRSRSAHPAFSRRTK